ncbi:transposase [Paractinoplanes rishiriensis]|uniref:IS5 family transposase n=1 Tax=Paractinoplanes rishiriensis TaxID=1050105 RepID=A0A919MZZ3_9ACTN|nr:transposase [Actinoplanes rishiriensis]GIF02159.1 IS5 family transposase [Actinoplanes rishiriensis]
MSSQSPTRRPPAETTGQVAGDKGLRLPRTPRPAARTQHHSAHRRKGIESSQRLGRHRYVIERCLEWTTRFRRLARRYERKASHFLGYLRLACAVICYRRADRLNLLTYNDPN